MPECTCRTICSFGEQPRSTSSPTWPTFSFIMMPDWTFQKWYITPSFLGGLGWAQCPFLLRSEIAAVKWGTKSQTRTSREAPALQLSTSQFKSSKLLNGNTQTNYCHQLRAQFLSISAVLGWGQKWGATWVPVGSGRGMWYYGRWWPWRQTLLSQGCQGQACCAIQMLSEVPFAMTS